MMMMVKTIQLSELVVSAKNSLYCEHCSLSVCLSVLLSLVVDPSQVFSVHVVQQLTGFSV